MVQKLKIGIKVCYKKWSPKLIFINETKNKKNPSIFDIENQLWKYDFGTFWRTVIHCIHKIQRFPLSMLILGQKSCLLGPTIFEIPQPNWYYCINIDTRLFHLILIVSILDLGKCKIQERWIKKSYYWKETTEGFERNKDTPTLPSLSQLFR